MRHKTRLAQIQHSLNGRGRTVPPVELTTYELLQRALALVGELWHEPPTIANANARRTAAAGMVRNETAQTAD